MSRKRKAKGRLRGKQPKLSPMQEAHLVELYRSGAHTVSELEELFGVTRSTVYRAVRRAGNGATALQQTLPPAPDISARPSRPPTRRRVIRFASPSGRRFAAHRHTF
jgi:DNA invertase Pin-like site-specific DNA recombinase